jgi:hypothetical protein
VLTFRTNRLTPTLPTYIALRSYSSPHLTNLGLFLRRFSVRRNRPQFGGTIPTNSCYYETRTLCNLRNRRAHYWHRLYYAGCGWRCYWRYRWGCRGYGSVC